MQRAESGGEHFILAANENELNVAASDLLSRSDNFRDHYFRALSAEHDEAGGSVRL